MFDKTMNDYEYSMLDKTMDDYVNEFIQLEEQSKSMYKSYLMIYHFNKTEPHGSSFLQLINRIIIS